MCILQQSARTAGALETLVMQGLLISLLTVPRAGVRRAGTCSGCRELPLVAVHRRQMSGAFRMVPSPEQGTSHRILSKARQPWPCSASGPAKGHFGAGA